MKITAIVSVLFFSTFCILSCGSTTEVKTATYHPELTKYSVGDTAHGGIVFFINKEGTHGLVVACQDQQENATFQVCYDLVNDPRFHDQHGAEYFDWRLPKLWEAYEVYLNLHLENIGDFSNSGYWTSEASNEFGVMHVMNFSKGVDHTSHKMATYRARGVRTF